LIIFTRVIRLTLQHLWRFYILFIPFNFCLNNYLSLLNNRRSNDTRLTRWRMYYLIYFTDYSILFWRGSQLRGRSKNTLYIITIILCTETIVNIWTYKTKVLFYSLYYRDINCYRWLLFCLKWLFNYCLVKIRLNL
jgi:hypothetical protein